MIYTVKHIFSHDGVFYEIHQRADGPPDLFLVSETGETAKLGMTEAGQIRLAIEEIKSRKPEAP